MRPAVNEAAVNGLKFAECLPLDLALEMLERRLTDAPGAIRILSEPVAYTVNDNG